MRAAHKVVLVLLFLTLVGCDHASKHAAKVALEGKPAVALISGVFDLTYIENRGVAFSLLANAPQPISRPLLVASSLAVLLVLFVIGAREGWRSRLDQLAFALVAAGAVGNAIDRAVRGYVVDFLHLHYWPVFNAADVLIVIGCVLFIRSRWRRRARAAPS